MVAQGAETPPPGTLVSGIIPPLADPYFERPETGPGLASGLFPGQAAVLTHGAETEAAPAAQGGTGKTQLAAEFARTLWSAQVVEVLIWVTASTREAVIAGYAQAAGAVGASGPDADAQTAAAAWWRGSRAPSARWALVLDDLADPADLEGLWPSGRGGQVVITTRLPGTAFSGGALGSGALGSGALGGGVQQRPAACGSCRSAGSAAGKRCPTSGPGSRTIPSSGSRRSTSARTSTACPSPWPRRPR